MSDGARILIAYANTGGGHRAAADALRQALERLAPGTTVILRDVLLTEARWPLSRWGVWYPRIIDRMTWAWKMGFRLTDSVRGASWMDRGMHARVGRETQRMVLDLAPDAIVCTHPLLVGVLRAAAPTTPLITVVTDLVTGHATWYHPGADLTVVPSIAAGQRAAQCGVPHEQISVLGVPVPQTAVALPGDRRRWQAEVGWSELRPTVLLVGGAEGMGPVVELARAVDAAALPVDLAVVAGRNARLRARLDQTVWRGTVHRYGFVESLPAMLRAAATVVTKAGPGTIAEACAAGCPLVLYGAIPGQETGNVAYVTQGRAGVWAPTPLAVVTALDAWFTGRDAPAALRRAAQAARSLARPNAASDIARRVLALAAVGRRASGTARGTPERVAA